MTLLTIDISNINIDMGRRDDMKKFISLFLTLCTAASLQACGQQAEAGTAETAAAETSAAEVTQTPEAAVPEAVHDPIDFFQYTDLVLEAKDGTFIARDCVDIAVTNKSASPVAELTIYYKLKDDVTMDEFKSRLADGVEIKDDASALEILTLKSRRIIRQGETKNMNILVMFADSTPTTDPRTEVTKDMFECLEVDYVTFTLPDDPDHQGLIKLYPDQTGEILAEDPAAQWNTMSETAAAVLDAPNAPYYVVREDGNVLQLNAFEMRQEAIEVYMTNLQKKVPDSAMIDVQEEDRYYSEKMYYYYGVTEAGDIISILSYPEEGFFTLDYTVASH